MRMAANEKMSVDDSMNSIFPVMDCYEYLDFLKEDHDLTDALMSDKLYVDVINEVNDTANNIPQDDMINLPKFDHLENFSEQCLSASDTSLADQSSPKNLYSPELVNFAAQNSPSSGSTDSGIITGSNPSSPILSPNTTEYADRDLLNNFGSILDTVGLNNVNSNEENVLQNQLLMKYLIQQQVHQALLQQQSKEKLQQLQQEAQLKQQQLLLLAQQQQLLAVNSNQNNAGNVLNQQDASQSPKTDSQLRKMLQQTKHNIINSLHGKKAKNISFKFNKSSSNNKMNKRKLTGASSDEKAEKILALSLSEGNLPMASSSTEMEGFDVNTQSDKGFSNPDLKQSMLPDITPQTVSIASFNQPTASGIITSKSSSENMFIPQPNSTFIPATIPTSTNPKVPITRLKPSNHSNPPVVVKYDEPKKTRVEHVVIEKRYRMKITDSLNELKCMLSLDDDKKPTKNSILQAAIIEIKRLKQENDGLTKRYNKMKKIFDELRKVGILASGQSVSSSSSESSISDVLNTDNKDTVAENIDPLVKQDHFASPFQRQSARDGAKMVTCFGLFMFLCINPLNYLGSSTNIAETDGAYNSRHLMSVNDQEPSPHFSLASNLINILLSLVILMLMVLRGNPRCTKSSTITQCFRSQMSKAQRKIDRHEYEEAKGFIRIALFVVGNSCPKTLYGQLASFLWKCICHILYQLGVLKILESVGYAIFPSNVSSLTDCEDQKYTARYSAEAYRKLHEIALKDPSSTYLEAACYLMNAIYAAEIAGDHELLCTAYATAVIHMQERLWFSYFLQYYFFGCAHHASLASSDRCSFGVDWIFESRGYEYFTSGLWDIRRKSAFHVYKEDTDLHEEDLLEIVYSQFQENLLMKSIRRMVVPEMYYPNERKIELWQRAKSFLSNLGTGPADEQLDVVSIYHQSLYGWWGSVLNQLIDVIKNGVVDVDQVRIAEDYFEDVDENHRHDVIVMAKGVISSYIATRDFKKKYDKLNMNEVEKVSCKVQDMLHHASRLIEEQRALVKLDEITEKRCSSKDEMVELIFILCCDLVVEANFLFWQIDPSRRKTEKELDCVLNQNEVLLSFVSKYPELAGKAQQHDYQIQCMSGNNQSELNHLMKRAKHIQSAHCRKDSLNGIYSKCNHYPLKQDGFTRCR